MSEIKEAVMLFRSELESIEIEDLKVFAQNALSLTSDSFYKDASTVAHTKKTFKIVKALLEQEGTKGALKDVMLVATLLQDICENDLPDNLKHLHPLCVKEFLKDIEDNVQKPVFDGIINIIEGHEAEKSPSTQLDARPGTPGFIIALANKIARMDFITVEL
jgi:hypothetical protein